MVRKAKRRTNEKWSACISDTFKVNEKNIWRGVNEVWKIGSHRVLSVRNSRGGGGGEDETRWRD